MCVRVLHISFVLAQMALSNRCKELGKGMKSSASSVCALTGMTLPGRGAVLVEQGV